MSYLRNKCLSEFRHEYFLGFKAFEIHNINILCSVEIMVWLTSFQHLDAIVQLSPCCSHEFVTILSRSFTVDVCIASFLF